MQIKQFRNGLGRTPAESAFGSDAEVLEKPLRELDPLLRRGESAVLMNQPEIDFDGWPQPKLTEGLVVSGIHPIARNRHVHPSHIALGAHHDSVGEFHTAPQSLRLNDVLVPGIAVAKMNANFDIRRHKIDMTAVSE